MGHFLTLIQIAMHLIEPNPGLNIGTGSFCFYFIVVVVLCRKHRR